MDLIKFSIKNPVTIIVSVLIVVLFGFLSLTKLPYQLTPSVTKPEIKITTAWPGATPYEIEREIIEGISHTGTGAVVQAIASKKI